MEFAFWIWLALAALFVLAEIFTLGFFLFWFGLGAGVAAVLSYLGVGIAWQLLAFLLVGLAGYLASRPLAERLSRGVDLRLGAERFIGRRAFVTEPVDPRAATGRVRVEQEEWKAVLEGEGTLPVGDTVEVVRVEGNHLVVRSARRD